jgi:hypothetical protein
MSSARISFPKTPLGTLLKAAGGIPAVEALAAAQANLDTLKPECVQELKALVLRIEEQFSLYSNERQQDVLNALYTLASEGVGLGVVAGIPAVDPALISLCKTADHLEAGKRWDKGAIEVHVRTLKFLTSGEPAPQAAIDVLLKGLEQVNAHYKPPVDP